MTNNVSLYIPCYNVEQYIAPVIEGVLRQSRVPDEILVIDDGCKDRTVEIASRYPVRVIRHETNKGLGAACNTGVRNSRHELVASVSADVVPDPDWLENLLTAFNDPEVGLAGGRLREGVLVSAADYWRQAHMPMDWGNDRLLHPEFLFGNNAIVRKKAVEEGGWYGEQFRTNGEDVDISSKIRSAGYLTVYEPSARVMHIRHDTIGSVMATFWRWHWYESKITRLRSVLGRAVLIHFRTNFFNFIKQDVRRKKYGLLWLDFLTLFYQPYFDYRLYLSTIASPERVSVAPEPVGVLRRDVKTSSDAPR